MAFECFKCQKSFEHETQLKNHLINSPHHHYCELCQKDFVTPAARNEHIAHARNHQTCRWCAGQFDDLKQHHLSHHQRCWQCDQWFQTLTEFDIHCCSKHKKKYCLTCHKVFKSKSDYQMHRLSSYHQTPRFQCPSSECHTPYISEAALVAHLESGSCLSGIDQSLVDEKFVLLDSSKTFIRVARLSPPVIHQVPINESGKYPCSRCPKILNSRAGLLQHLHSSKHSNNGRDPYKCPVSSCKNSSFPSLSSLLFHHQNTKCNIHQGIHRISLNRILNDLFQTLRNN